MIKVTEPRLSVQKLFAFQWIFTVFPILTISQLINSILANKKYIAVWNQSKFWFSKFYIYLATFTKMIPLPNRVFSNIKVQRYVEIWTCIRTSDRESGASPFLNDWSLISRIKWMWDICHGTYCLILCGLLSVCTWKLYTLIIVSYAYSINKYYDNFKFISMHTILEKIMLTYSLLVFEWAQILY